MSTRATAHFCYGPKTLAIVYRHSDGYLSGMGKDLIEFFKACAALSDSRLNDPTYLAAKYVVWLAGQFNKHYDAEKVKFVKNKSPLEFLSVGVVMEDPDDIEYKYVIDCEDLNEKTEYPSLRCFHGSEEVDPVTDEAEVG